MMSSCIMRFHAAGHIVHRFILHQMIPPRVPSPPVCFLYPQIRIDVRSRGLLYIPFCMRTSEFHNQLGPFLVRRYRYILSTSKPGTFILHPHGGVDSFT